MSFPWFIAKRFIFSKKESRLVNFISTISIIGIALGVATLIIALSVLRGFEQTLTNKIVDFDSHIKITSFRNTLPNHKTSILKIEGYLKDFSPTIIPFASKLVIVSDKNGKDGLNLIGIDPQSPKPGLIKDIVKGEFNLDNSNGNPIIIGKKLANKLFLKVGDVVTVFALKNDKIPNPINPPNIEKFKVAGIFESGMAEYDDTYAYTSLETAQHLFGIGDRITGYNIKLKNITKIDSLTKFLSLKLRYPYAVRSIYQIHRNIFTWIQLQKEPIPIVLGLIIIVAVFNIIGTLLMIILERINSIGVLKSIGAKRKQIVSIFLFQGMAVAVAGIIIGNLLALILMEIQLNSNLITLPSSVYFMSKVPIMMTTETFIFVSAIAFILSITASLIPSYIASHIRPIDSLRFS
ncbi:lipoprotein-releasing system transmembrane protein LolE [bacterium BMS3Abin03]|nr:lipoprotein-releasing system transmembrane protein LolE [bacterium BMS3Abin03]